MQDVDSDHKVFDALELFFGRRFFAQAVDLEQNLLDRSAGVLRRHVGRFVPVAGLVAVKDRAVRRIGVALVLADVGGDARAERSAEDGVHHLKLDVFVDVRRGGRGHAEIDRRLRSAGTVDDGQRAFGHRGRHVAHRGDALFEAAERFFDLVPDLFRVELADDVEMRARRAVLLVVKRFDLFERVAFERRFAGEDRAVGMVRVDHLAEFFEGDRVGLRARDGQVAELVGADRFEVFGGEFRVEHHFGQKLDKARVELGEHLAADRGFIGLRRRKDRSAHLGRRARDVFGRARRGSFFQKSGDDVGDPALIGFFVERSGADKGLDGHFRHRAVRDERHFHPVRERVGFLSRKDERFRRSADRRRFLLRENGETG